MHNTMELLHQMRSRFANVFWQALQMAHEGGPIAPTDLLRKAANGLERLGRYGEEAEEARHALVAAGVGRGDRGGRNAGDRGKGERDRGRNQPYTYRAHHGENQGHNTADCIVMCREFDRYYDVFHEYLQTRGLGPYATRTWTQEQPASSFVRARPGPGRGLRVVAAA